jgi:HAD superfamily hydrolase (TIGR01509 family)
MWQKDNWKGEKPVNAVIFDMDGVIFDTERLAEISWVSACRNLGVKEMTHDVYLKTLGTTKEFIHQAFAEFWGADFDQETLRRERIQKMNEMIEKDGIPIKPGFEEFIAYLKKQRIKTAIASATHSVRIVQYFDRVGLSADELFDGIIGGEMVVRGKPFPDIFMLAADHLNVPYGECVVIEDSYGGIRAGYDAGMRVIMVPDMLPPVTETLEILCAHVDRMDEIIGLL